LLPNQEGKSKVRLSGLIKITNNKVKASRSHFILQAIKPEFHNFKPHKRRNATTKRTS